jgi:hypothetical protein
MRNNSEEETKNKIQEKITKLTNRSKDITTERNNIEKKVQELQKKLKALKVKELCNNRDKIARRQRESRRRLPQAARDRFEKIIVPGDKVRFLTSGLFKSTEGIVTKIGKARITARDSSGFLINRSPNNVEVIEEENNSEEE